MKKIILATMLAVFLGLFGTANADMMSWEETITWNPAVELDWQNKKVSYTHDITNDGFNPLTDKVTDYRLTVSLYDDKDTGKKLRKYFEAVKINQPGKLGDARLYTFSMDDVTTGWSFKGLASLNSTGTLDVTVKRLKGDFFLEGSGIVANGTAPVPEPSTILLFGAGLAGLVGYSRKRSNKKA